MSDDVSIPNPGYHGKRSARYGRAHGGMDPDTKRLVLFAGGLGGVLTCLIVGSSLIGHRSTVVPVVAADTSPIRVRPENPGGMQIDAAENDVFSGGGNVTAAKLAPPAETPNPNGLHDKPKPVAKATAASAGAASLTASGPAEAKPAAVATQPAEFQPSAQTKPAIVPSAARPAAPPATAAKPADAEATAERPTIPAATAAKPSTIPGPARDKVATAASAHPAAVQLAALSSEQAAREEWQQMTKRMPELLNGHQPVFTHVEHDGHGFWRVRTTGFSDAAQARTFCEHVKAKGGNCSVADF